MSKFNRPISPRVPDAVTAEGGDGFSRSAKDELFLLGIANMVGEDTFYEDGQGRDNRFAALVQQTTRSDPKWTANFIRWLRSEANMRSAPIVAAAEYVRAGGPDGRQLVSSVLQRPDEPGEMLGYWFNTYGRHIPQPVKRGVADALPTLYTERNTLKYDGSGNAIRFGDVVDLVHPKPSTPKSSALYRHLIDRRHGRGGEIDGQLVTIITDNDLMHMPPPERRAHIQDAIAVGWSWERLAGWLPGGMDAEGWEAVIPNMGLMALTRNLRNFDEAGISDTMVHAITGRFLDPEEVRKSRQFPLRFLTAWKNVQSMRWGLALESALESSVSNVPSLGGKTLLLVDVSGSMIDVATTQRKDARARQAASIARWEVASLFATSIAKRAEDADVVLFNTRPVATLKVAKAVSALRAAQETERFVGGGTNIMGSLASAYANHDRVIILTDEQTGARWHGDQAPRCPVYVWNLGGYRVGVTPNERNWHTFGGLTDAAFNLIPLLEGRRRDVWPWDVDGMASGISAS